MTLPKQCSTRTPKGEPKIFWNFLRKFRGAAAAPRNFQSKFDCKKYVQHYMLRYYAIRAYKFALEVSNKQSLFGNQRFSAQHYNQNYSECYAFQARSAPLVSNGRPARKAIILIIFYYLFKNNNKINHFNVLFDLLLPTAFAARRIVKNIFAYLGSSKSLILRF